MFLMCLIFLMLLLRVMFCAFGVFVVFDVFVGFVGFVCMDSYQILPFLYIFCIKFDINLLKNVKNN